MYVLTDTPHYMMYWHTVLSLPFFQKILSEHAGPISSKQNRLANPLRPSGPDIAVEKPRSSLSPLTNSLLEQLEARIKELKAWLRDTELLIFNSCLREHKDASEQLQSFKVGRALILSLQNPLAALTEIHWFTKLLDGQITSRYFPLCLGPISWLTLCLPTWHG